MFSALPQLSTPRLCLRELSTKDCYDLYSYARLPDFGPSAGWEPHENIGDTISVIRYLQEKCRLKQSCTFAVCLKAFKNKMIGLVELHSLEGRYKGELGYSINPLYQNKGYATEAALAIIEYGFKILNLKRIECYVRKDNYSSIKVCEKLNLSFEGLRKKGYRRYDGVLFDVMSYAIVDDEYYQASYQDHIKTIKEQQNGMQS